MIALPKTASNHHMAHKSFSVCEQEVQRGTFPRWLPHQLCQEVICHTLQEPPRLFPFCCIVFPADIRQVEVPHKNKGGLAIKHFFTESVTKHWNRLPRDIVESPSLEILKSHLDMVQGNML
ncbi:hypothetical protein QYF61_016285 [Mycteria americana]|uniref:Uncharacterized protein n=1 Tax=Mycteria americana TaxID=33587 RepID=A0AAN7NR24_MYCAM|nr:hypothetical protein QYF61_016285 [Mycteria americana]